jgi:phosphoglucomutase
MIDKEVDEPFIAMVKNQCLRPALVKANGPGLKVVYTPLNGAGAMPVERALRELGISLTFVPEQEKPDGNFPTVKFPNPEEASALKLALDLGKATNADLVMGTDPDADRLGIAAPDGAGFRLITGNELGALLLDYILISRKELGTLPKPGKGAFIKTIVTTELERLIAEAHGLLCYDVLTGFKYIGEKIREFETMPDGPVFVFGNEESYGYLTTPEVRDKDAVSAATLTAEMTLYHRHHGRSLVDQLKTIWKKYGYFKEIGVSGTFKGQTGLTTMKQLMETLRNSPPASIGGVAVETLKDYRESTTTTLKTGKKAKDIHLPCSNVLKFFLADGSSVTARPSGTEPKIKFYISCRSTAGTALETAMTLVAEKISAISGQIKQLIDNAQQ